VKNVTRFSQRDSSHAITIIWCSLHFYLVWESRSHTSFLALHPWLAQNIRHNSTGAQPGGGAFALPEIFKIMHSNFDICRNFQRI